MTGSQLSVTFFLQMFVILAVCRLVGLLARRLGQPQVVGEMVAGVLLGPSLFGLFLPSWQQALFPADSMRALYVLAQLGIGVYMFLVGVEFNTGLFRSHARSALAVSLSGMVVPFLLGVALTPWLLGQPGLFSDPARQTESMLFLGAAMAITAFPMLARIIDEHGLTGTRLGTLALAAGAIDDAAAWCVLAIALGSMGAGPMVAVTAIGGGIAYAVVVLTIGRRALARLGAAAERRGSVQPSELAWILMLLMLAAWFTDRIGLHAVFGGFVLGVAMPRGRVTKVLREQLEPFAVVFILPVFFTYTGLNTRLDMVNRTEMIVVTIVILAAACAGKALACWAAARWAGEDNRTAMAIGTLMNARGLMGLIILDIGLQKHIIEPALFSMMVLMAIVTTLMASPVFEWVYGREARRTGALGRPPAPPSI